MLEAVRERDLRRGLLAGASRQVRQRVFERAVLRSG
jgi:hypothetical protein